MKKARKTEKVREETSRKVRLSKVISGQEKCIFFVIIYFPYY